MYRVRELKRGAYGLPIRPTRRYPCKTCINQMICCCQGAGCFKSLTEETYNMLNRVVSLTVEIHVVFICVLHQVVDVFGKKDLIR